MKFQKPPLNLSYSKFDDEKDPESRKPTQKQSGNSNIYIKK